MWGGGEGFLVHSGYGGVFRAEVVNRKVFA